MTREEAIKMLKSKMDGNTDTSYEWAETVRMAINALEQEPCEDCVSRQAVLDAVRKNTFRLTFAEEQGCEGHIAWSAEAVYSDVIEGALLELPSARPKTKWIPIVERPLTDEERQEYDNEYDAEIEFMYDCELPEDSQDVLITTPFGVIQTTFYTDYGCYFENYEGEGYVTAWMPLPTPYEPKKSEETK